VSSEEDTAESNQDTYQGISWADRAKHGILGAVLDPADIKGKKNAFIDCVHRIALSAVIKGKRYKRTLDFGCGTGRFLALLSERSDEVYALDRTPEMLEVARSHWHMPNERFVCWREQALPFASGYFDFILSVGVLCTAPSDDLTWMIGEIGRICSDGGTALIIEQVDQSRDLTPTRYRTAFEQAGFATMSAVPIRAGSSRIMHLASSGSLPKGLIFLLAAAEILRLRGTSFLPGAEGYWDYRFVFRRAIT